MNPNLISQEMVQNFKSVSRITENVITYYFENFLSTHERGIIAKELGNLRNESY